MSIGTDQNAFIIGPQYNLLAGKGRKYEPFEIDNFIKVYRLAHRPTADNVMVKFDTRELDNPE